MRLRLTPNLYGRKQPAIPRPRLLGLVVDLALLVSINDISDPEAHSRIQSIAEVNLSSSPEVFKLSPAKAR